MSINFDFYDLCYIMAGFIPASIIFLIYLSKLRKEIRNLKKQYEKKSVGMDDSSLKIKTLENKIKTLETALKKQMES